MTDMLVSYIKLINNSRMYYRCLVLTFQFLNQGFQIKKKRKLEELYWILYWIFWKKQIDQKPL